MNPSSFKSSGLKDALAEIKSELFFFLDLVAPNLLSITIESEVSGLNSASSALDKSFFINFLVKNTNLIKSLISKLEKSTLKYAFLEAIIKSIPFQ